MRNKPPRQARERSVKDMHLFLAHADDHSPVLPDGLPERAAYAAPPPPPEPHGRRYLRGAPPDALPGQGWALLAPRGPAGDRLLRLIAPLRARREEDQRSEALVYRVDPGMGPGAAAAWIQGEYWDAVGRRADRLPRYLLILGGPELISWDLQQLLGADVYAGRLAFPDDAGHEAYVEKVLRWEREEPLRGARALFYAVHDGTCATVEGYRHLLRPSLEIARELFEEGRFPATQIVEIGGEEEGLGCPELSAQAQEMLMEAGRSRAGLLFSMSHGAGAPRAGWSSPEEQRAHQGAMVIGAGERLGVRDVGARPFLPGGLWFYFACYGAGTPARSAYYPWLDRLHRLGHVNAAARALSGLPRDGSPPFVAALPQAALANPDGPLGVVGHVDLAWTWGFLDHDLGGQRGAPRGRPERFQTILKSLVNGHRLGVAHHDLARYFRSLSVELSAMYDDSAQLGAAREGEDDDEGQRARRAALWMQRQDLAAYVLLGDPAARLPIALLPAGVEDPRHARELAALDAERREAAVMAVLRGGEVAPVAAAHRVAEAQLRRWVEVFLEAGRAALAKAR